MKKKLCLSTFSTLTLFNDLIELSKRLCLRNYESVDEVIVGPELHKFEEHNRGLLYSINKNFMYLSDDANHVFIDIRAVDPFEVGEEYILISYGIYGGIEKSLCARY